jgi:hypothetical protein
MHGTFEVRLESSGTNGEDAGSSKLPQPAAIHILRVFRERVVQPFDKRAEAGSLVSRKSV